MIRIAVLDDHKSFRQGLTHALIREKHEVVLESGDADSFLLSIDNVLIDLLILDLRIPKISGYEVLRIVKQKYPTLKVLILSSFHDTITIKRLISMDADGHIGKEESFENINAALHSILSGNKYFPNSFNKYFKRGQIIESSSPLTDRETTVLRLICKEKTSVEIADILNISVNTVKNHRKSIHLKTGSKNLMSLLLYGIENGHLE
jgi:DNA-binding NarL/FixJ family response regulator